MKQVMSPMSATHLTEDLEHRYNRLSNHPDDVIITLKQAAAIWKFFKKNEIPESMLLDTSFVKPRAFLQAALMTAMAGSAAMSYVEALFRSAYKPNATVVGIITALAKTALKRYFSHESIEDLKSIKKLYTIVVDTITYQGGPYFDLISQGVSED